MTNNIPLLIGRSHDTWDKTAFSTHPPEIFIGDAEAKTVKGIMG